MVGWFLAISMAPVPQKTRFPKKPPPRWFWIGSLSLLFLGIIFFVFSLAVNEQKSRPFFVIILIILVSTLVLHAYYLLLAYREHHAVTDMFNTTDREFRSIFEHAFNGILVLNDQSVCLNANPAALRILRVAREHLLGSSFSGFFRDQGEFSVVWNPLLRGKNQRGGTELVRHDNTAVFVDYAIVANYISGRHAAILCDTTERRIAEATLLQSQELLQEVTDNVHEVVWMLNAETKELLYVSNAYEALTGHTLQEIRENPSSYKDLVHSEDRERFLARLEQARTTRRFDEEVRIVRSDGVSRWMRIKGTSTDEEAGDLPRLVGIAQDITDRKTVELEITKQLAAIAAAHSEAEALQKARKARVEG